MSSFFAVVAVASCVRRGPSRLAVQLCVRDARADAARSRGTPRAPGSRFPCPSARDPANTRRGARRPDPSCRRTQRPDRRRRSSGSGSRAAGRSCASEPETHRVPVAGMRPCANAIASRWCSKKIERSSAATLRRVTKSTVSAKPGERPTLSFDLRRMGQRDQQQTAKQVSDQ